MELGAIAFVLAETIFGKLAAKVTHHPVTRDFGDHTGGGDAQAHAIAIDNRGLRQREWDNRQTVDQHVIGWRGQGFSRHAHRPMTGPKNIDPIDLDVIDSANRPGDIGIGGELVIDFFTPLRRELLGIVQTFVPELFGENNCCGDNRAGQSAASCFIDSSDANYAEIAAKFFFMPESAATIHRSNHLPI